MSRSQIQVPLSTLVREWGRIGLTGIGGPPAHIFLLRRLCVDRNGWLGAEEFEDGLAATNLLPGPASTQLAIFCAWRLRGWLGAVVGGVSFILPGLVIMIGLCFLFLGARPPLWVRGAGAGAGAVVPAVALAAAAQLLPANRRRAVAAGGGRRWPAYLAAGAVGAVGLGGALVLVLLACGAIEAVVRRRGAFGGGAGWLAPAFSVPALGSLAGLAWVAFKVGALAYGGGFVIVPLMQHDATVTYHWMSAGQFLDAVALGQATPGPVVLTVAAVGYAAAGVAGALFASAVAFAPSFLFVVGLAPRFGALRASGAVQNFLSGASACAIGAIAGASIPLALALSEPWEAVLCGLALVWLMVLRRGTVPALLGAAGLGVLIATLGGPLGR